MPENHYAFDNCSIIHSCEIIIPNAFRPILGKSKLSHKNYFKLSQFIQKLNKSNLKKFRFVPSNADIAIIGFVNQLIVETGITIPLPSAFKAEVNEQIYQYTQSINQDFIEIQKENEIKGIKTIFVQNEKMLKKGKNIPETEDLEIIAGYQKHICEGNKYFISEDEHFWGYKDLIKNNFNICIIEEWNCLAFNFDLQLT